ncbi:MAG: bifunctional lysylphosphatidylglycerol flippase/synthetase MprF [Pirellulaceae bacterium]|nr:bifunctional lysylphosphatidylglycerol flippase/synthetase MprF [Planctomycetales bacterium]
MRISDPSAAKSRLRTIIGPLLILALLGGSLWLLHGELRHYQLSDFRDALGRIPLSRVYQAAGLTVVNYIILMGYDILGLRYLGHRLNLAKIAFGSFLGYAVGHNLGTLFGGSTIRYRLYSSWGLSAVDVVKLVLMLGVTFWVGLFALAGFAFLWEPLPIPPNLPLPFPNTVPLGYALAVLAVAYLAVCAATHKSIKLWRWEFSPPRLSMGAAQIAVASCDLLTASAILYLLLPSSVSVSYWQFLAVYLLTLVSVLMTQVPGGVGILELMILTLLKPSEPEAVVGSLLAFRTIYYLAPLALGSVLLAGHELSQHGETARKGLGYLGKWAPSVVPRIMALTIFIAGAMLLFSGATPIDSGRMNWLRRFLPLPLIELSHFASSIVGMMLLVLARGIQRRIEIAYYFTVVMLSMGIVASLVKALDWEESLFLAAMLAAFVPCRREFFRKGALLTERFTPRWIMAVAGVLVCTFWLMSFAYKHVEYSHELWWKFEFSHDAPRSMRALAGALILGLFALSLRMMRAKGYAPEVPERRDWSDIHRLVQQSRRASSHLALIGDKYFLFDDNRTGFIMYGESGRSWIAMGDPIAERKVALDLAWEFRERCDVNGRLSVFYQVDEENISMYVEMGLALLKIGEEARVPLAEFGLEGAGRKNLRRTHRQLAELGCTYEILQPPIDTELLSVLKHISDSWLLHKQSAEKGFSLGFFHPDYIAMSPVAVVRQEGQIVAFANLWLSADHEELSLDLMRYLEHAPPSVMEFLFVCLMLWGKEQGFRWFNLGMAPLSGIESQPRGPMWNQLASLAYRHGENFYNFQGLRQYKEKFDPVWDAKYVAAPGGLSLPIAMTNVTTLISGGLTSVIRK